MKKVVFYQTVSAIFMIVILILFSTLWKDNEHSIAIESNQNPRAKVIEMLDFNEDQIDQYDELMEGYKGEIMSLDRKINLSKKHLYQGLHNENIIVNKDSLIHIIGEAQMRIEQIHLNHFKGLKVICREDQQDNYRKLTQELANIFGRKRPKRRPKSRP